MDSADSMDTSALVWPCILLVVLGFGIRWLYTRLLTGGFSKYKADFETEGSMRTRIDHGDL